MNLSEVAADCDAYAIERVEPGEWVDGLARLSDERDRARDERDALDAEVRRLTPERNALKVRLEAAEASLAEAREEIEQHKQLNSQLARKVLDDRQEAVRNELDLTAEAAALRKRVGRLEEVARSVLNDGGWRSEEDGDDGLVMCAFCCRIQPDVHAADCPITLARAALVQADADKEVQSSQS